jgi:hypothetical protein
MRMDGRRQYVRNAKANFRHTNCNWGTSITMFTPWGGVDMNEPNATANSEPQELAEQEQVAEPQVVSEPQEAAEPQQPSEPQEGAEPQEAAEPQQVAEPQAASPEGNP